MQASAWARCGQADADDPDPLPCRHALGVRDLDALAGEAVRTLNILVAACDACPREGHRPFEMQAEAHRLLRHSRGKEAVDVVLHRSPAAFAAALRAESARAEPVDEKRRRLFAPFLATQDRRAQALPAGALAHRRPEIDPTRCTGCDACIRLCPDDALAVEGPHGEAYLGEPDRCSGCGLCVDVCEAKAVRLVARGAAAPWRLALDPGRCRLCGVAYHRPAGASGDPTLCRICAVRPNGRRLFQVLGR